MSTKAKYRGANLQFYDSATSEIVGPMSAVVFHEDFLGKATLVDASTIWSAIDQGAATEARVANQGGGVFALTLTSASEAQDAGLYWGDEKGIDLKAGAIFEARVKLTVDPGTGVRGVFGLAGPHNLDKDTVAVKAWFSLEANAVLLAETEDTTNTHEDKATGITMDNGTWYICRIDCTTLTDVRFFVDGAGVATSTTFDMSNLSDAEAIMQPYFSLDKPSDTSLGQLYIDGMTVWANRTS